MSGPGLDPSKRALLVVIGCMMCQMGAGWFYATRTLSPDVIADLGWTRTMWSSGMAPMVFISSLTQAFVGTACVRFGVRPVVVCSVLSLTASVVVLATMQGLAQFYVAAVLMALGNAGIGDVSIGGVVTRWFERHRSLAMGVAMVGTNLGAVAFIGAMAGMPEDASWRTSALVVGVGGFAIILPFAFFVVRDPREGEGAAAETRPANTPAISLAASLDLPTAMRSPAFWILLYTLFCYALVQLGLLDHLVLYLIDLGYTEDQAKGAFGLTVAAGILSKIGAGVITLRVRPKTALLVNTGLLATSIALIPFATDARLLNLSGLLFGLSTSARDVLLPMALADTFGARYFAQIYGVLMLVFIPGAVLGPLVLAAIHDGFGHYTPGFAGGVVLLVVAVVAMSQLERPGGEPG